jgi:HD-like signal output (HDOD) protein
MNKILVDDLSNADAQELLKGIIIPAQPVILMAVMQEQCKSDGGCPREIARLIGTDVGMSAAVLKTINSAYYGLRNEVDSIERAIMLLGIKNVATLVMAFSLRNMTSNPNMITYWANNTRTAMVSNFLAKRIDGINKDDVHLYSLFHDSGEILMMQHFVDYPEILQLAARPDENLISVETSHYLTNHMLAGALLARAWGLPKSIRNAISRHHDLDVFSVKQLSTAELNMIAITQLAEYMIANVDMYFKSHEWTAFKIELLAYLEISTDQLEDLTWEVNEMLLKSEGG